MKTLTKTLFAFALFFGIQACGTVDPATLGGPDAGAGAGGAAAGGDTGTGGTMAAAGAPGTGTGGSVATAGQTGAGGQPATGGSTGTGGTKAGGGSTGTGGAAPVTSCMFQGTSGSQHGVSQAGTCRACAMDSECVTAYGTSQECLAGSCTLVGPLGPMPRMTCNIFSASFANGPASVTSSSAVDQTNASCVTQAANFLANRPSVTLCMGVPNGYTATVLSVTTSSANSDDNGNCNATVVAQMNGASGCLFDITMNMLAQAPPKATPDQPGPFPPPSCN